MYARRILREKQWNHVVKRNKCFSSSNCRDYSVKQCLTSAPRASSLNERRVLNSSLLFGEVSERCCTRLHWRSDIGWSNCILRFYSSEGDGRNASEDKQVVVDCGKEKIHKENSFDNAKHRDAHACLGEHDQIEWLKNEKLAIENRKKDSPFITRRERIKNEISRRIVPWEKITVSWDTFPYYLHENTKHLLVECAASHLKHKKFTADYGGRLTSSSGRILLQSIPGMELYRERMVRALARDLQVPIMVLDGGILAPYDFNEDESESDEDNSERTSESEIEDENDASNEEDYTSSGEARTDGSDDEVDIQASAEALRKLLPCEEFEKSVNGESESSSTSSMPETSEPSNKANRPLKKGDQVKYTGPSISIEANNKTLCSGQRGEVYEVNDDQVAVVFDFSGKTEDGGKDEKRAEPTAKPSVCWLHVKDIEHDLEAQTHDCFVAIEVLREVLESQQPLVVYFPDSSMWLSKAVSKSNRTEFVSKMQEMFDKLSGPVVLICGRNKVETGSNKEKEKFTMILPNLGRLAKLPLSLKSLTEGLKSTKRSGEDDIYKLFTNVMSIHPPKEEDLLGIFNKQIEDDKRIVISRSNLSEMHRVLEDHDLSCMDLLHVNTDDVILTKESKNLISTPM